MSKTSCFFCGARKRVREVYSAHGTTHAAFCPSCDVDIAARLVRYA